MSRAFANFTITRLKACHPPPPLAGWPREPQNFSRPPTAPPRPAATPHTTPHPTATMGAGRHLRPLRVHQIASRMLETGRLQAEPPWYRIVGAIPPTTSLVRELPVQLNPPRARKSLRKQPALYKPQKITYPEDELRQRFFQDHPWELARPRIVVENDGRDSLRWDWSRLQQPGKALDGERYVGCLGAREWG